MADNVTPIRSVTKAAESDDRRQVIVAMRDRLWTTFMDPTTPARDLSPLVLRLLDLAQALADLDNVADDTNVAADTPDEPWNGEGY